jgi:UDP-N-acetylglucosamine 2-epimerase
MSNLNLAAFGNQRRIETVALGVIVVVVNYDRFYRQQNPEADRIAESREFRELMKDLEINYSDIGTAKRIVKQELKKQEYF